MDIIKKGKVACVLLVCLTILLAQSCSVYASVDLVKGPGNFIFYDHLGGGNNPVTVWYYCPKEVKPDSPILFAIHGVERNAKKMRDVWLKYAQKYDFILLAPEFSETAYPQFATGKYKKDFSGPRSPLSLIEHLFDHIKRDTGNLTTEYYIYGHSAGGQFVHRLVLLRPNARIKVAIAANAGWYTMPDFKTSYPYGLKHSGMTKADLAQSFQKNLIILLGENDTDEHHKYLNRSSKAMVEGSQRFERGNNFYAAAKAQADNFGMGLAWKLITVPGVAHQNSKMSKAAAELLFDK